MKNDCGWITSVCWELCEDSKRWEVKNANKDSRRAHAGGVDVSGCETWPGITRRMLWLKLPEESRGERVGHYRWTAIGIKDVTYGRTDRQTHIQQIHISLIPTSRACRRYVPYCTQLACRECHAVLAKEGGRGTNRELRLQCWAQRLSTRGEEVQCGGRRRETGGTACIKRRNETDKQAFTHNYNNDQHFETSSQENDKRTKSNVLHIKTNRASSHTAKTIGVSNLRTKNSTDSNPPSSTKPIAETEISMATLFSAWLEMVNIFNPENVVIIGIVHPKKTKHLFNLMPIQTCMTYFLV